MTDGLLKLAADQFHMEYLLRYKYAKALLGRLAQK